MDLYETLGVSSDADQSEIKQAFRKKAQETHPDRDGGDKEAFQKVNKAYEVLSVEESRQRYDKTGDAAAPQDSETYCRNAIFSTIMAMIDQKDVDHNDLVSLARANVENYVAGMKQQKQMIDRKIITRNSVLGRLTEPDGGMIKEMIKADIKACEQQNEKIDLKIQRSGEILKMLDGYSYRAESVSGAAFNHAQQQWWNSQNDGRGQQINQQSTQGKFYSY